jgi:hypothetical protein
MWQERTRRLQGTNRKAEGAEGRVGLGESRAIYLVSLKSKIGWGLKPSRTRFRSQGSSRRGFGVSELSELSFFFELASLICVCFGRLCGFSI